MKNVLILIFAAATIVLGVICVVQSGKSTEQQALVSSLTAEAEQKTAQIAELESAQKHSGRQRGELQRQADELAAQLRAREAAETQAAALVPTNPPTPTANPATEPPDKEKSGLAGFGKFLSQAMKNPEAKKLIESQQRLMTDQTYSPLIKQMGLTPEEADQFKTLLTDNMVKGAEKAFSMFEGLASTNRSQIIEQSVADQNAFDEKVKDFLGDARYAQYKDYQETVGERMQLNQFKQQTTGSDHPLNDQQTEQLLAMMKEERRSVAAASGLNLGDNGQDPAKLEAMFSEEKMGQLLQVQETLAERVYERARTMLYPDQLEAFGRFQTNQVQTMRLGLNMARKFMAPDKADGGAAQSEP